MRFLVTRHLRHAYNRLEREIVGAVHAFWADTDPAHLRRASRQLDFLLREDSALPAQRKVIIRGWIRTRGGVQLSRPTLRQLNPTHRVTIHRHSRKDTGRLPRLFRRGFEVTMTGPIDGRTTFALVDRTGSLWGLPGSSEQAWANIREIDGPDRVSLDSPDGYIDSIDELLFDPLDRHTWFPNLLAQHPRELLELVESPSGRRHAIRAANSAMMVREQPFGTRWIDRFAMAAYGHITPMSDLSHLTVVRPNPNSTSVVGALMVPTMKRSGPIFEAVRSEVAVPKPSDEWLTIDNARVQDGGTVLTSESLVVYEHAADPTWDFVGGQWHNIFGSPLQPDHVLVKVSPPGQLPIDEAVLLSGRHDANWYHWFVEYLPRVIEADSRFPADVPFLVTTRVPPTGLEALARLSKRAVIVVDPNQAQLVERLHLTAPVVQILDTTRVPWSESLTANPDPLRQMRRALGTDLDLTTRGEKVFLLRSSGHRRLLNESAIAKIAEDHGFRLVNPAGMTFADQLDLFARTRTLVSAGGAVMANYLMLPPRSTILALTSNALVDFILPAVIAQVSDSRFSYVSGPTKTARSATNEKSWIHEDFTIRPSDFVRALERIESSR